MSETLQESDELKTTKTGLEIGVLGSARLTESDEWWARAHQLGALLAGKGFVVVTGGYGGLMAAVSRGAHEAGGKVIGLTMQHWTNEKPNQWNADLRWSMNYGARLNHFLNCDGFIALPGGVGTLTEIAVVWATIQTEGHALPLVLLGECWPPIMQAMRENLVINERDLDLLRFAASPEDAVRELQIGLQEKRIGSGPYG
jgi:uncharacterized protein (TIGR00730 family)